MRGHNFQCLPERDFKTHFHQGTIIKKIRTAALHAPQYHLFGQLHCLQEDALGQLHLHLHLASEAQAVPLEAAKDELKEDLISKLKSQSN
jgi:hypothetical protein